MIQTLCRTRPCAAGEHSQLDWIPHSLQGWSVPGFTFVPPSCHFADAVVNSTEGHLVLPEPATLTSCLTQIKQARASE